MKGFMSLITVGAAGCGLAAFIMQFSVKSDLKEIQEKINAHVQEANVAEEVLELSVPLIIPPDVKEE